METYGVSFEGFEPSCGWPMYKHTEEELIPHLKNEVVRWRERRDEAANERAALKGLKADLEGMMKSRDGLIAKLQAKIPGGATKVNDVMPLAVKAAKVETSGSWQELASWLASAISHNAPKIPPSVTSCIAAAPWAAATSPSFWTDT